LLTITLNPALDIAAHVPVVEPDRKLHCTDATVEPGGGGVNVARVAHRLGASVTAAVLVGGGTGAQLVEQLRGEGVGTEPVAVGGSVRQSFTAVERASGRQFRFVLPGPVLGADERQAAWDQLVALAAGEDVVVVSGSVPPGVDEDDLVALLRRIRADGADLVVDSSDIGLRAAATVGALLLKPSVNELSRYVGVALSEHEEIAAAARELGAVGPSTAVVVSMGAAGALLVPKGGDVLWFHAPRVHVVSTVGAGDSLVAATVVALQRGAPLAEAVRAGVAAGTAATLASGTGLCARADVERLLPLVTVSPIGAAPGSSR
jgi:6-phosphofructokinase 2